MNMKTTRAFPHLEQIEWIGKLADLKDAHYRQSLLLDTVIELLIDKGIVSAQEIAAKARTLEDADNAHAAAMLTGDPSFILHPDGPTP